MNKVASNCSAESPFLFFDFEREKMPQANRRNRRISSTSTSASATSIIVITTTLLLSFSLPMTESAIGVNWGSVSSHKLKPSTVVDLLKDNKIQKVKLFDADPDALVALMRSGIQVMVGIPNEMLATLSSSTAASDLWVRQNVSRYLVKGGADIRYSSIFNIFPLLPPSLPLHLSFFFLFRFSYKIKFFKKKLIYFLQ